MLNDVRRWCLGQGFVWPRGHWVSLIYRFGLVTCDGGFMRFASCAASLGAIPNGRAQSLRAQMARLNH